MPAKVWRIKSQYRYNHSEKGRATQQRYRDRFRARLLRDPKLKEWHRSRKAIYEARRRHCLHDRIAAVIYPALPEESWQPILKKKAKKTEYSNRWDYF
jgi:hypothetical protein